MKTFVVTFNCVSPDDVNIAVTCPQDQSVFKTFTNQGDFVIWIDKMTSVDIG